MRFPSLLILVGVIFLSTSCSKNDAVDLGLIWVESKLFLCCNVWGEAESMEEIPGKVSSFFRSEGMIAQEVEVVETGFKVICVTCCQCPTEHNIRVRISSVFKAQAASFGFEEF